MDLDMNCQPITCLPYQFEGEEECEDCLPKHYQDPSNIKKCIQSKCNFETQIMRIGGGCDTCPNQTLPDETGQECTHLVNNCKAEEFFSREGKCEACPKTYLSVVDRC